ncbi:MAG: hypothetical protein LBQ71_06640 [Hungatella sp.]|jgi:hypothetical protein|nr:hypothetical protein [Hungatella sp.]
MGKSGPSYQDLILDLPVKLHHIKKLKIEQSLDNHAAAYITGVLKEENHEAIHRLTSQTNIKIKAKTEEGENIIFSGIPEKATIKRAHDVYAIAIVLKSHSVRLDIQKKRRSFQNQNNPYGSLFKTILQEYEGDIWDAASRGAVQNGALIQYEETDWEFLKRTASRVGAKLFPEIRSDRPRIYIGIPEGNRYDEKGMDYCLEKKLEDYLYSQENHGGWSEQEILSYRLESMEDYQLGDKITYQGITFTVAEKITELKKGILAYQYRFQIKSGLKQNIRYNPKLKGVSVEGKVLAVEKDKVKLHLSIDSNQNPSDAAWYPFSTSYASEGTTGWYSMPQEGDSVRLYMPTADESEAYVQALNRLDGEENPKVQDPAVKYYGTSHGKEMKLAPKELTFSAAENVLYLKMGHETGIEISSPQDIHIKTQKKLLGECQTLEIESKEKILLATQSSGIIVDDIVHIKS